MKKNKWNRHFLGWKENKMISRGPLWLQKMNDEKLSELLNKIDDLQLNSSTSDEELISISETWYDNNVGMERFTRLSIDAWKEAAYRFTNRRWNGGFLCLKIFLVYINQ